MFRTIVESAAHQIPRVDHAVIFDCRSREHLIDTNPHSSRPDPVSFGLAEIRYGPTTNVRVSIKVKPCWPVLAKRLGRYSSDCDPARTASTHRVKCLRL